MRHPISPRMTIAYTDASIPPTPEASTTHNRSIFGRASGHTSEPTLQDIKLNMPGGRTPCTTPAPHSVATDTSTDINSTGLSRTDHVFAISAGSTVASTCTRDVGVGEDSGLMWHGREWN